MKKKSDYDTNVWFTHIIMHLLTRIIQVCWRSGHLTGGRLQFTWRTAGSSCPRRSLLRRISPVALRSSCLLRRSSNLKENIRVSDGADNVTYVPFGRAPTAMRCFVDINDLCVVRTALISSVQ